MEKASLKVEDLDVSGSCFGIKFRGNLIEIYIEDDENWHYKMSFHPFWITDLIHVLTTALARKINDWLIKQ